MKALGVPVHNTWGLCPARLGKARTRSHRSRPFTTSTSRGLLKDVTTLSFHRHLPHYEITERTAKAIHVLARQPIDLDRPHPFTEAGEHGVQLPAVDAAQEQRAGDIVLVDSTHFTTLFGGTESLKNFWRNLAAMR